MQKFEVNSDIMMQAFHLMLKCETMKLIVTDFLKNSGENENSGASIFQKISYHKDEVVYLSIIKE